MGRLRNYWSGCRRLDNGTGNLDNSVGDLVSMNVKGQEMRIRVEPKEFFMYSIFLAFNKEHSDSEDEAVKAYLEEHELIPKRRRERDSLEGQEYDVMYFGGCYLGRHLNVIGDMQRKAVEREMLAVEIERILNEEADPTTRRAADNTPSPRMKELITSLAEEAPPAGIIL